VSLSKPAIDVTLGGMAKELLPEELSGISIENRSAAARASYKPKEGGGSSRPRVD
jgi:hypothetical protein